jgi:anti-sigma factor RsiW
MNNSDETMTRYLLGELSEPERSALEEKYFSDPKLFDDLLETETELLDKYVRGLLPAPQRERLERSYLFHPRLSERMKFAESLAARVDQFERVSRIADESVTTESSWSRMLAALRGRKLILAFSAALVLILIGAAWLIMQSRRSRQELARLQAAQKERELPLANAEDQVKNSNAGSDRERSGSVPSPATASPVYPPVSFALTVSGTRGASTGPPPLLSIPAGTDQIRLQLNLKENDYSKYQVLLQPVGGKEIFGQGDLVSRAKKAGATLVLMVPARKFATGDYMLTLKGVTQNGEVEEVSKSLFRVEKK